MPSALASGASRPGPMAWMWITSALNANREKKIDSAVCEMASRYWLRNDQTGTTVTGP